MPNRILKESICTSDSIDALTPFEETVFYRLIVNCDDYGRFDGRIAIIKARLFPLKDVRDKQIEDALTSLSLVGIVQRYECNQRPYVQLSNWESHQQIRSKKSKYPAYDSGCCNLISDDINCNQMISNAPVIQSNPNPNPNPKKTMCTADADALFKSLWTLYPNKKGKGQVSAKNKARLLEIGEEHIRRCIDRYTTELAKEADWRKPQNGSTFFNSGYIDYLDENYTPSKATSPKVGNKNKFNNFQQRDYDFDDLETKLLNR